MKDECVTETDLLLLSDGELSENRASSIRSHLAGCASCRAERDALQALVDDLRAPPLTVTVEESVQRMMARLDGAQVAPRSPFHKRALYSAIGLVAAAALVFLVPRFALHSDAEFQARGMAAPEGLRRDVGVSLYSAGAHPTPVVQNEVVDRTTPFVAGYRNLYEKGPVFLMAFGVDASGTLHWLYPAYERPGDDPSSVVLEKHSTETLMPTTVVLDAPSEGAMRFISIVTKAPLRVSTIESLHGKELDPAALRIRFPGAEIQDWRVIMKDSKKSEKP